MDGYAITPLRLGTITRPKGNMVHGGGDELVDFPLVAFYLEGFGHRLLVDTGGSAPDGARWMPYARKPEEALPAALKAVGAAPGDIDAVVFTHLHWDHAGNNAALPRARFYVQRAEYGPLAQGEAPGYERELVLRSRYELLDGDTREFLPGLSVLLTPGHSSGSQCVLAQTPGGTVVLAGDLIPTYENLERDTPNGGYYDYEVIAASMARVRDLGLPVLPGHEAGLFLE